MSLVVRISYLDRSVHWCLFVVKESVLIRVKKRLKMHKNLQIFTKTFINPMDPYQKILKNHVYLCISAVQLKKQTQYRPPAGNPKHEALNPKQGQKCKTKPIYSFWMNLLLIVFYLWLNETVLICVNPCQKKRIRVHPYPSEKTKPIFERRMERNCL